MRALLVSTALFLGLAASANAETLSCHFEEVNWSVTADIPSIREPSKPRNMAFFLDPAMDMDGVAVELPSALPQSVPFADGGWLVPTADRLSWTTAAWAKLSLEIANSIRVEDYLWTGFPVEERTKIRIGFDPRWNRMARGRAFAALLVLENGVREGEPRPMLSPTSGLCTLQ